MEGKIEKVEMINGTLTASVSFKDSPEKLGNFSAVVTETHQDGCVEISRYIRSGGVLYSIYDPMTDCILRCSIAASWKINSISWCKIGSMDASISFDDLPRRMPADFWNRIKSHLPLGMLTKMKVNKEY